MMTKSNRLNKRYCAISNLEQLELERDRLHYKMGLKELELHKHVEDVKETLTFSNICRTVWARIEGPKLAMMQGFNLFSTLLGKKRKKHTCSF